MDSYLLRYAGADAYQYFDSGKMAGAAILSFRSADKGAAAFQNLSSTELFGKKLQVEFVRRPKRCAFHSLFDASGLLSDQNLFANITVPAYRLVSLFASRKEFKRREPFPGIAPNLGYACSPWRVFFFFPIEHAEHYVAAEWITLATPR